MIPPAPALRLSRRRLLLATAAALVLPLWPGARVSAIRIVDGWVLTGRDIAALGRDAG